MEIAQNKKLKDFWNKEFWKKHWWHILILSLIFTIPLGFIPSFIFFWLIFAFFDMFRNKRIRKEKKEKKLL